MPDSSVLLRIEDLLPVASTRTPIELAVLASSILVLLGNRDSIAPRLAEIVAGRIRPVSGRVLVGERLVDVSSREARELVRMVDREFVCPEGITVRGQFALAVAAAGSRRSSAEDIIHQLASWCSLDGKLEERVSDLSEQNRYLVGFATTCIPIPQVLVMQGPVPVEAHKLMQELCDSGCTVVIAVPGVEYVPRSAERVVLCSEEGIVKTIRMAELSDACVDLMKTSVRISVKFYPALTRTVMEGLSGSRDIVAIEGGYSFHHDNLSMAVTNLVNLARANHRTIVGLVMHPPSPAEVAAFFSSDDDGVSADLFCPEDLDI